MNPSLLREMWSAAASLEFLPIQTKTQLGDELVARIAKGDFVDTGLWCLARLGARKLFYGPINQVLPRVDRGALGGSLDETRRRRRTRWRRMARRTGDSSRDLPAPTLDAVRRAFPELDLDREPQDQLAAMGKIFGEELPAGLVFHE